MIVVGGVTQVYDQGLGFNVNHFFHRFVLIIKLFIVGMLI